MKIPVEIGESREVGWIVDMQFGANLDCVLVVLRPDGRVNLFSQSAAFVYDEKLHVLGDEPLNVKIEDA